MPSYSSVDQAASTAATAIDSSDAREQSPAQPASAGDWRATRSQTTATPAESAFERVRAVLTGRSLGVADLHPLELNFTTIEAIVSAVKHIWECADDTKRAHDFGVTNKSIALSLGACAVCSIELPRRLPAGHPSLKKNAEWEKLGKRIAYEQISRKEQAVARARRPLKSVPASELADLIPNPVCSVKPNDLAAVAALLVADGAEPGARAAAQPAARAGSRRQPAEAAASAGAAAAVAAAAVPSRTQLAERQTSMPVDEYLSVLELTKTVSEHSALIEQLTVERNCQQRMIAQLRVQLEQAEQAERDGKATLEAEKKARKKEADKHAKEKATHAGKVQTAAEHKAALSELRTAHKREVSGLKEKVESLEKQLKEADTKTAAAAAAKAGVEKRAAELVDENQSLKAEVKASSEGALADKVWRAERELGYAQNHIRAATKERDEAIKMRDTALADKQRADAARASALTSLHARDAELASVRALRGGSERDRLESEMRELKRELEQLRGVKNQNVELTRELNNARKAEGAREEKEARDANDRQARKRARQEAVSAVDEVIDEELAALRDRLVTVTAAHKAEVDAKDEELKLLRAQVKADTEIVRPTTTMARSPKRRGARSLSPRARDLMRRALRACADWMCPRALSPRALQRASAQR